MDREPVRLTGWTALAVGAVLQAVILWSAGTPPEGIAGAIAAQLVLSIGGLEWARNRVTPEASAQVREQIARVSS